MLFTTTVLIFLHFPVLVPLSFWFFWDLRHARWNMSCPSENQSQIDQSKFWDSNGLHWTTHRIGWAIAGGCAVLVRQWRVATLLPTEPGYRQCSFQRYPCFRIAGLWLPSGSPLPGRSITPYVCRNYTNRSQQRQMYVFNHSLSRYYPCSAVVFGPLAYPIVVTYQFLRVKPLKGHRSRQLLHPDPRHAFGLWFTERWMPDYVYSTCLLFTAPFLSFHIVFSGTTPIIPSFNLVRIYQCLLGIVFLTNCPVYEASNIGYPLNHMRPLTFGWSLSIGNWPQRISVSHGDCSACDSQCAEAV